ncbi:TRAP transporter substrate-binding protein [Piscinibacter sakaiensis]|uniref:TRAP transporter substrate-binding protein n=1 Tax=Piscinibacter sakaiensis TaxID=1547922 RepID=UPI003AAF485F
MKSLHCRILARLFAGLTVCLLASGPVLAAEPQGTPLRLRVVGGLGKLNQYTRHEQPFWTRELQRLSEGRLSAEIVPFDQVGLSGHEMLRLLQIGAVPFGTALLPLVATQDPELGAADLPGLNPDMSVLRKHVAAFRPHLEQRLRERWGVEMLAVYVYPAQVTFCNKPFANLADLAGRRIRSSNPAQSDLVEAIGAVPVQTAFADIVPKLRSGDIECAITGTMSGNTIGLHEVTSHVHTMAANWGLAIFGANAASFAALPPDLQALLRRQLRMLELSIWADAQRETGEGLACNSGSPACVNGRKGRMVVVDETPADVARWREIFVSTVLPRWVQRCGPQCAVVWNNTLKPVTGIEAKTTPP